MKFRISFFLLMMGCATLHAQSYRTLVRGAETAIKEQNYYGACELYKKAWKKKQLHADVAYAFAQALRLNKDYAQAIDFYSTFLKIDTSKSTKKHFRKTAAQQDYCDTYFWLAECRRYSGAYPEALADYQLYLDSFAVTGSFRAKKAGLQVHHLSQELATDSTNTHWRIEQLPSKLNSPYSEFGISRPDSGHLFTSRYQAPEKDAPFNWQIYGTQQLSANRWTALTPLDTTVNAPKHHNANMVFNADRTMAYFARCPQTGSDQNCQIYRINHNRGHFYNATPLPWPINIKGANTTQPQLTIWQGKEVLLYASDRPGGYGMIDLWYSIADTAGRFTQANNMGETINSPDNDITPVYQPADSTLYFASQWYKNYGGFDIFSAKGTFGNWQAPQNLGKPLNSELDEMYYLPIDSLQAYFSSNRMGSNTLRGLPCCTDLYLLHKPAPPTLPVPEQPDSLQLVELEKEIILEQVDSISEAINNLLPISLYFDNDQPNPRTRDTATTVAFQAAYTNYLARQPQFVSNYAKGLKATQAAEATTQIDSFFSEVRYGYEQLDKFAGHILGLLKNKQQVHIALQGYSSPLSNTEYNRRLSMRRVSCIYNYFMAYQQGVLRQYFKPNNGGQPLLVIEQVAMGEQQANDKVSDKRSNKRLSVYSPMASRERRLQIIDVMVAWEK